MKMIKDSYPSVCVSIVSILSPYVLSPNILILSSLIRRLSNHTAKIIIVAVKDEACVPVLDEKSRNKGRSLCPSVRRKSGNKCRSVRF